MTNKILVAALLLAAGASLAACSPKKDDSDASATASNVVLTSDQRQHIRLTTVAVTKFHRTIDTTGVVDFDNDKSTSVLAPISGPVTRILVAPGDKVQKGQALAAVASSDFAAAVSTYTKALATAQTSRRLADMDKDLIAHDGVARREEEQAQTDAANAEADRDAALQGLTSLGVDPQTIKAVQQGRPVSHVEGMIRAPIAGTVVEKLVSPGQLLQAGTTAAFTVADLSRVWVMAQIFGSDITAVSVGDRAEVATGIGSGKLVGSVENISALVNPDTRSVIARVAVQNPMDVLKKQMYVHVELQARQESSGILVPASAVLRDDENLPFVYIAQPDGSFARQHVTLGSRVGDSYEVADLKPGLHIVTDGGIFMQFMQSQ